MAIILNLLTLNQEQKTAFLRAASGYEQVFAPEGVMEDGTPVSSELYRQAGQLVTLFREE